mgnify:CR=1 FL=1
MHGDRREVREKYRNDRVPLFFPRRIAGARGREEHLRADYTTFMPLDTIIGMYQALIPSVDGLLACLPPALQGEQALQLLPGGDDMQGVRLPAEPPDGKGEAVEPLSVVLVGKLGFSGGGPPQPDQIACFLHARPWAGASPT